MNMSIDVQNVNVASEDLGQEFCGGDSSELLGEQIVDLANEVVAASAISHTPGALLHEVLSRAGAASPFDSVGPAALFDTFVYPSQPAARRYFEHFFDVLAVPGTSLKQQLRPGDVLIRRGESGFGHEAIVAGPERWPAHQIREVGLTPESARPGEYAQVVEYGFRPHRLEDSFARMVVDANGNVPYDQLILRFKPSVIRVNVFTEVSEVDESIPSANLQWSGASQVQTDFMRSVYERQVSRAASRHPFVGDIPESELNTIEGRHKARTAAAADCRVLLSEAKATLDQQKRDGSTHAQAVERISVVSAYRSASEQFTNWQTNFPRYYEETRNERAALTGGEHGDAAADYLASYIGRRLAAPGYSLHNNGLAVDFGTRESGRNLGASTQSANISRWRQSWFFQWLTDNASRFNFYQNLSINEPWHWEYRGSAAHLNLSAQSHDEAVLEADILADMRDEAVAESNLLVESVAIPANQVVLPRVPLLSGHRGAKPDLILRWNDMLDAPRAIDVVVHLHGYCLSGLCEKMNILDHMLPKSGLDFHNPDDASDTSSGRVRPTLAILPHGNYAGCDDKRERGIYTFPALVTTTGLRDLIDFSLGQFAQRFSITDLHMDRLILTAHSGGGAPLMRILQHIDPVEVYVFDALYQDAEPLIQWARNHIRKDLADVEDTNRRGMPPLSAQSWQGGALRVFFRKGTEANSRAVHRTLCSMIPQEPMIGAILTKWYRVERTSVPHLQIPRRFGWRLLADAGATVPDASPLSCISNQPRQTVSDVAPSPSTTPEPVEPGVRPPNVPPGESLPPKGTASPLRGPGGSTTVSPRVYSPQGEWRYTPAAPSFRCNPNPVGVTPATLLPTSTSNPDDASRTALRQFGLDDSAVSHFENEGGIAALQPIAGMFGAALLLELLRRLRYSEQQIADPLHTYNNAAEVRRRLGVPGAAALLAPRLLLAIPGHFRELARHAQNEREAFALENLGWLLMKSVRSAINSATGINWWIPSEPLFVTPFANPPPTLSQEVQSLVLSTSQIDTTLSLGDYIAGFNVWNNGLAGRAWRLETGLETASQGSGMPFYTQLVSIPGAVNFSTQRQQIDQAWQQRLTDTDRQFPTNESQRTQALTRCDDHYLRALNLMQGASLQRLQLVFDYPAHANARVIDGVTVLAVIQPVFEQIFRTVHELGWNDLLFQTAGAGCFRGVKLPPDPNRPQRHHQAARRMSNHSLGIAIDFNTFENTQHTSGSMDPRIVALFEAFHFNWGRCFPVPDPMHFEYCGAACP